MHCSPPLDPNAVDRRVIEIAGGLIEVSPHYPYTSKRADRALQRRFPDIVSCEVDENTFVITVSGEMKERDNHVYISIRRWDQRRPIDYPFTVEKKACTDHCCDHSVVNAIAPSSSGS